MSDADVVAAALERRRGSVATRWGLERELVLIGAGWPIPVPGRGDRAYPFRAHSEYFYLTDRERPGGVLAFDPQQGWTDFVLPVSREEIVWEGVRRGDQDGVPVSELAGWLERRHRRATACLGAPVDGIASKAEIESRLRAELNHVRRQKDQIELARMRAAERATRAGFAAITELIAPGRSERALQIELEAEFLRRGADAVAFDTIVGGGPNSAVLHFAPSQRPLGDGELVLIDAGGECRGYASDITRTYPVSGVFAAEQRELHALVRSANRAATERCIAGVEFRELHLAAAHAIAEGLIEFGLLRGRPQTLVERGTVSLFFPHGIGHMVGLGVRDGSEILAGRKPDPNIFPGLRVDLALLPGQVVTIEPGIYFIEALLRDPGLRADHRDAVDWSVVERMLEFGGIRIEDNVLVTEDRPEVLTADVPLL